MQNALPRRHWFGGVALLGVTLQGWFAFQQRRNEGLQEAIQQNDAERIRRLAGRGVSMQPRNEDGKPLLIDAIRQGKTEAARALMEAGADPNANHPSDGRTALMEAALLKDDALVRILLQRGATVEAKTSGGGRTALMYAAINGRYDAAKALLDQGADINAQDRAGRTALCLALQSDRQETALLLLQRGANPNLPRIAWTPPKPKKPAQVASFGGAGGGMSSPNRQARYRGGESLKGGELTVPLHSAIRLGDETLVRALLDRGADLESRESDGQTPLMRAARLYWAAEGDLSQTGRGHPRLMRLLLERGVNVHSRDDYERTALFQATHDTDLMRLLLDRGADPKARCKTYSEMEGYPVRWSEPRTVFDIAATNRNAAGMRLLLKRGAKMTGEEWNRALYLVFEEGYKRPGKREAVELLRRRGATLTAPQAQQLLTLAASQGDAEELELLQGLGADLNAPDANGITPIRAALRAGNQAALHYLSVKGVTPTDADSAFAERTQNPRFRMR